MVRCRRIVVTRSRLVLLGLLVVMKMLSRRKCCLVIRLLVGRNRRLASPLFRVVRRSPLARLNIRSTLRISSLVVARRCGLPGKRFCCLCCGLRRGTRRGVQGLVVRLGLCGTSRGRYLGRGWRGAPLGIQLRPLWWWRLLVGPLLGLVWVARFVGTRVLLRRRGLLVGGGWRSSLRIVWW